MVGVTADSLADNARSYAAAAERLVVNDRLVDERLAPAFYLLIGFSLELILKAICRRNGMSEKEIKDRIGHDLHEAYMHAMAPMPGPSDVGKAKPLEKGKAPRVMTPLGRLILAFQHELKWDWAEVFRYTPGTARIEVPPPAYCLHALREAIPLCLPGK